jgi:hypothetical protein
MQLDGKSLVRSFDTFSIRFAQQLRQVFIIVRDMRVVAVGLRALNHHRQ